MLMGIRFALFADLMLIVGLAVFLLYSFGPSERGDPEMVAIFAWPQVWLCGAGLVISALGMGALTASMHGVDIFAVDWTMFRAMVRDTDVGAAWIYRMAALLVAFGAACWLGRKPALGAVLLAVTGSVALATLVWSGHAGATEGDVGTVHRANDALHMIAAAVWFGAIAAFLLLLRSSGSSKPGRFGFATKSLDQFAQVGTICVLVIAATGLVNSQIIIGVENVGRSIASPYGQLLVAKLALFALMLALAAANRWRLTPALKASVDAADPDMAIRALRTSLILEGLAAVTILALVAWFGTLEPFLSPDML